MWQAKRTEATNAGNGGGQGSPYQGPPEKAPAEEEEVSETPMPQEKGMDWVPLVRLSTRRRWFQLFNLKTQPTTAWSVLATRDFALAWRL